MCIPIPDGSDTDAHIIQRFGKGPPLRQRIDQHAKATQKDTGAQRNDDTPIALRQTTFAGQSDAVVVVQGTGEQTFLLVQNVRDKKGQTNGHKQDAKQDKDTREEFTPIIVGRWMKITVPHGGERDHCEVQTVDPSDVLDGSDVVDDGGGFSLQWANPTIENCTHQDVGEQATRRFSKESGFRFLFLLFGFQGIIGVVPVVGEVRKPHRTRTKGDAVGVVKERSVLHSVSGRKGCNDAL